jgi:hypothetical protein
MDHVPLRSGQFYVYLWPKQIKESLGSLNRQWTHVHYQACIFFLENRVLSPAFGKPRSGIRGAIHGTIVFRTIYNTPNNNNNRFGGVTTLQDNKKTNAIDI